MQKHEHEQRQEGTLPEKSSAQALPPRADVERLVSLVVEVAGKRALRWLEPDDAADLAQDVGLRFWKAWQNEPGRFDADPVPEEWIGAAVRHEVIDRNRAEKTRAFAAVLAEPVRDEAVESSDDAAAQVEASALGRHLAGALNALSRKQREVVLRIHDRGETYLEAATAMSLSTNTVKAHLARAMQLMRAALARYEGSLDDD